MYPTLWKTAVFLMAAALHTTPAEASEAMKCAQARLNELGFEAGFPDGVTGRRTRNAARAYVAATPGAENLPPIGAATAQAWCDHLSAPATAEPEATLSEPPVPPEPPTPSEPGEPRETGTAPKAPAPATARQGGFPTFTPDQLLAGLSDADCNPATTPTRSTAIGQHDGLDAFPARLCANGTPVMDMVIWTGTNPAGTQLSAAASFADGTPIAIRAITYDQASAANVISLGLAFNGIPQDCKAVKPEGGIAVFGEIQCETP